MLCSFFRIGIGSNSCARPCGLEDGIEKMKRGETTPEELLHVVPYEQIEEFRSRATRKIYNWGHDAA